MEPQLPGPCAQCSDTRNLYIKTCDCSKNSNITHGPFSDKGSSVDNAKKADPKSAVDTKKEPIPEEKSKLKAVKAVVYKVVRVYESRPPQTMKYIAVGSALLVFFAVLSVVLAQRDENPQSKYGMAFTLGETAASSTDEKRVAAGVPGEDLQATSSSNSDAPTTTSASVSSEETTQPGSSASSGNSQPESGSQNKPDQDNQNKPDQDNQNESDINPAILIAGDDDEKPEDGDQNPRIVFIERLMGLHVSAPANRPDGSQPNEPQKETPQEQSLNGKNPMDKVNAKWASRMRKFSIPIPNQGPNSDGPTSIIPPQAQEHPMLRYAAAAMMSRLVAAAARAQMEAQAREALMAREKAKDDENEDGTVPVIVATVREDQQPQHSATAPQMRHIPPMYGRPMIRPQMMRPPIVSYNVAHQQPRQLPSMAHRTFISPPQQRPQISPLVQRRSSQPPQPVILMVAVPIQQSESRQAPISASPVYSHRPPMPAVYPTVPYSMPYTLLRYQPQAAAAPVAMPIHVPVPAHSYPTPYIQRPPFHYPIQQRQVAAYSHVRPVVEVPVEVSVPFHYPVPVQARHQIAHPVGVDHDMSGSEPDHMILLYDAEIHHDDNESDLDPSASEGHERQMRGPKAHPFLARPLPHTASPSKLKLWRELAGAKHASQPGVRYLPVAVASAEESQRVNSHFVHPQRVGFPTQAQESAPRPAFIVLADPDNQ